MGCERVPGGGRRLPVTYLFVFICEADVWMELQRRLSQKANLTQSSPGNVDWTLEVHSIMSYQADLSLFVNPDAAIYRNHPSLSSVGRRTCHNMANEFPIVSGSLLASMSATQMAWRTVLVDNITYAS